MELRFWEKFKSHLESIMVKKVLSRKVKKLVNCKIRVLRRKSLSKTGMKGGGLPKKRGMVGCGKFRGGVWQRKGERGVGFLKWVDTLMHSMI